MSCSLCFTVIVLTYMIISYFIVGGSCISASVYLHGESVYIVCTITGMAALITMTVKHNEQDIAILKETEDVQYVVDTDIIKYAIINIIVIKLKSEIFPIHFLSVNTYP
jgi:hypothetical protein